MFRKRKFLKAEYQKELNKTKKKEGSHKLLASIFVSPSRKVPFNEKLIKLIIFVALRIVIKRSKWKNPEKNLEIVNRTYSRIMSADFTFIPSSIAFYIFMSFMPIMTLILYMERVPLLKEWFDLGGEADPIGNILGKFIPGLKDMFSQLRAAITSTSGKLTFEKSIPFLVSIIFTTWIAAGGFAKLIFTQSHIYEHKYYGGYWANRTRGMVLVLQLTIVLFFALWMNILLERGINALSIQDWAKNLVLYIVLIVSLFFVSFFGFALFFKFSPRFKIKFKQVLPGAMVAALPTTLFLSLFGTVSSLWDYGSYGSIGTIMYIGMSALIIIQFLFMGIISNAAYYKTFVGPKVRTKWTISRK